MTHLRIIQNNGVTEEVSNSVILKLYELASSGNLDNSSALEGRIHIGITYRTYKEYLEGLFNDFYILADDYAIPFEDPNMAVHLNSVGIGSGGFVTESLAANAININWAANTTVTKFNELRYFTNIYRTAAPTWGASETNNASFVNWTALLEIDISNYISVGRYNAYSSEWALGGCTSLTTVTASSKLKDIGVSAFSGDSNLTTISGLTGVIILHGLGSFYNCNKLTSNNFTNVLFAFTDTPSRCFTHCRALTSITLDSSTTEIPQECFLGCTNLTSLNGISNITSLGSGVFSGCTSLLTISLSGVTSIPDYGFYDCQSLTTLTTGTLVSVGSNAFKKCTSLVKTFDFSNSTSVGSEAFNGCSHCTFTNIDSLTNIGNHAFIGCTIQSTLSFGQNANIDYEAFSGVASIISLTFAAGCSIGHGAFSGCRNITSITFSGDCLLYGNCFSGCRSLLTVDLTNISESSLFATWQATNGGLFSECHGLTTVTLNPNLTKIPGSMFAYHNESIFNITIPSGVTEIGNGCFLFCNVNITMLPTTPPTIYEMTFTDNVRSIKVPQGSLSAYLSAPYWSRYANKMSELSA